jgi:hypothetical protein
VLDRLIADETYFYLIAGKKIDASREADQRVVFKIAKGKELFDNPDLARQKCKMQALHLVPFQTVPVCPDANDLALMQYERFVSPGGLISDDNSKDASANHSIALPTVTFSGEHPHIQIPFIKGTLLKEKINRFPASDELEFILKTFSEVSNYLESLSQQHKNFYHGNLKPSTIVATTNGIVLLEPGYYGSLRSSDGGALYKCFVSTLAYYPNLDTDDLLALGISLFECITGIHPFPQNLVLQSIEDDFSPTLLDKELCEEISLKRSLLEPYTTPLYKLQRPALPTNAHAAMLESCILKGLRLKLGEDGLFHKDEGFADFASFKASIDDILLLHQSEKSLEGVEPSELEDRDRDSGSDSDSDSD